MALILLVLVLAPCARPVLLGASEALTPSPDGPQDGRVVTGVMIGSMVGAVALALITLVLDAVVAVCSVGRLRAGRGRAPVSILALVGVGAGTVLPLALGALAVGAHGAELSRVAGTLGWLLAAELLVLAPCARLGQMIGGIVDATDPR